MLKNYPATFKSASKEKNKRSSGDPDYEEVGPQRKTNKTSPHDTSMERVGGGSVWNCDLCGSADARLRCERCKGQAFCFVCDETFHGHPKRASHVRKAIPSASASSVRPPLPRKSSDSQLLCPPQPPPRRHKKGRSSAIPFDHNTENDNRDEGGSSCDNWKKTIENRPLPMVPNQLLSDKRRNSTPALGSNSLTRSSPSLNNDSGVEMAVALPQSILDINNRSVPGKPPSASMPPTPPSHSHQYPPTQPGRTPQAAPSRKFSLQQFPTNADNKRASLVDGGVAPAPAWDNPPPPITPKRSQSVSGDQWTQMMALQPSPQVYPGGTAGSDVGAAPRRGYNTVGGRGSAGGARLMTSSSSVCDLSQHHPHHLQQQHLQQQQLQQQQLQQQHLQQQHLNHGSQQTHRGIPAMSSANSIGQLSVMSCDPSLMWMQPSQCAMCPPSCPPAYMYPPHGGAGLKRATSNISMNLSSMGADVPHGFPWGHAHHMPMAYPPGYYPGYHPPVYPRGESSPAPSGSSSHRSRARAEAGGRRSRHRSRPRQEDSFDSDSSSPSSGSPVPRPPKGGAPRPPKGGAPSWQCDHCTFINGGSVAFCGMCSKGRRGRDGGRAAPSDPEDGRRRGRRASRKSLPRDVGGLEAKAELERQLKELRLTSSRSRTGDYDGVASSRSTLRKGEGNEGGGKRRL